MKNKYCGFLAMTEASPGESRYLSPGRHSLVIGTPSRGMSRSAEVTYPHELCALSWRGSCIVSNAWQWGGRTCLHASLPLSISAEMLNIITGTEVTSRKRIESLPKHTPPDQHHSAASLRISCILSVHIINASFQLKGQTGRL